MEGGNVGQRGWAFVEGNGAEEELFGIAAQDDRIRRSFPRSVPTERPQKSLLLSKTLWVVLLAICFSFALKYLGTATGGDWAQATRLITATFKFKKKDDVGADGKPTDDGAYSTADEADTSSQLPPTEITVPSAESRDAETDDVDESDDEAASPYRPCTLHTVLRSAAPKFAPLVRQFPSPTSEAERWANRAGELKDFLQEKAGSDAADAFQALVTKEFQPERNLTLSTEVLTTTVLGIRKQRLARAATDCFNRRRRREKLYATMLIMEHHFRALKRYVESEQQLPVQLAKVLAACEGKLNMAQEEAALADAKLDYERALRDEWQALELLHYQTVELAGHVAVTEIFRRVDNSTGDWKAKMPKLQDMGAAMNDLGSLMSSEMLAISQIPAVASAVSEARNSTFGASDAAFKGIGKLAEIIATRRNINYHFRLVQDPESANLTLQMAHSAREKAYRLLDDVERLQEVTSKYLRNREGNVPEVEPWLAFIL